MKSRLLVVAMLLCGCGGSDGPPLDGVYSGVLAGSENCSDGSSQTGSHQVTFALASQGDSVSVDNGTNCAPWTAFQSGSSASLAVTQCPTISGGGTGPDYVPIVQGGTLTLNGGELHVYMTITYDYLNTSPHFSCSSVESGTLTRQ